MSAIDVPIYNRTTPGKVRQATVYPTGRFSIAAVPSPKRKPRTSVLSNYEKANLRGLSVGDSVLYAGRPASGACLLGLLVMARSALSEVRERQSRLGSSNVPISNSRSPRGFRGINWGQRDRLSWSVGLLERRVGKKRLSFLTLTLPNLRPSDRDIVRSHWAEVVNRFIIYLKRSLKYRGIQTPVIGATEIQTKRSAAEGWAVPHLHLVFQGRRHHRSCWAVTSNVVRKHWKAALEQVTGLDMGDCEAVENIQQVRKSAAGYLSKYLSKCASKQERDQDWYDWHPSDWVVLGRKIRQGYNTLTLRSQSLVDSLLEKLLGQSSEYPAWLRPIEVQWQGSIARLGWVGKASWLATSYEQTLILLPDII